MNSSGLEGLAITETSSGSGYVIASPPGSPRGMPVSLQASHSSEKIIESQTPPNDMETLPLPEPQELLEYVEARPRKRNTGKKKGTQNKD